jgi:transcriptional regulator with XRE-family HTH domain
MAVTDLKNTIQKEIESLSISKAEMARRVNIEPDTFSRWLRGKRKLSLELEMKIHDYLRKKNQSKMLRF